MYCVEDCYSSSAEELFFKHPVGYNSEKKVLRDPNYVKNNIENKLKKDGLKYSLRRCTEIPKFEIEYKTVEKTATEKALAIGANIFLGDDVDVEYRIKKRKKQVGTEVEDFWYDIKW